MAGQKLGPEAVAARLARDEDRRRIAREHRGAARRIAERDEADRVRFRIKTYKDTKAPWSARLQAVDGLDDRYGPPKRTQESVALEGLDERPKLFIVEDPLLLPPPGIKHEDYGLGPASTTNGAENGQEKTNGHAPAENQAAEES